MLGHGESALGEAIIKGHTHQSWDQTPLQSSSERQEPRECLNSSVGRRAVGLPVEFSSTSHATCLGDKATGLGECPYETELRSQAAGGEPSFPASLCDWGKAISLSMTHTGSKIYNRLK